ncbi:hypothetical protein BFJ70_g9872 [Fusarium oxysporum]|uniref:Uncharacterized protein n=1 Tax=Fusarium oxysporum f. sp. cepae TaxID=396571 RepID=A0A3L6NMV2_FUSOX|nr:hypothetical protein BFJ65_g6624 [Fusarium oxysporum f. sp. cepae]RKK32431.1 hypothetical protein BFJ66_g15374 [Fusarium oxysporum f. sp. cepae]RKK38959.1 hypothetical protein BFJ67_g11647 [Fusarium oxysporum f. sp. cepae]RKL30830.1 hypothetical protein BFJ70_g9872 [Fusarium oxysporum]
MKSTIPILALQSVVVCAGFTMPEKSPNGVYSVHVNDQGVGVYDGLTVDHTTTVTPMAPSSHLKARQWRDEGGLDRSDPETFCGCGGVGEVTQAWYSIWGDVVTDTCGWYVPGTLVPSSIGFDTVGCGYMNYSPGLDFCAISDSGKFMGRNGRS